MSYGIIVPLKVAAHDVGSYVRSAISATTALENGNMVVLNTGQSTSDGKGECWLATQPATATLTKGVWMVAETEVVETVSGNYSFRLGIPDPGAFEVAEGEPFRVIRLNLGDVFLMSADVFSGSKSSNGFAQVTDAHYDWVWNSTVGSGTPALAYLATSYISIPDGSIGTQRVAMYKMEVAALA